MDRKRNESMLDFTLNFLRPAPPKMNIRPSHVRKNLFPEYRSIVPPNEEDFESPSRKYSSKKPRPRRQTKHSSKNLDESSASAVNFIDYADDDEDVENEMLELEMIVDRMLKREYKSETDLVQVDRYEFDGESAELDDDARIFRREPRLVRTLSDTLLTRKQHTVDRSSKWNRFNFEEDFLRIDSNYNDAIEEVSLGVCSLFTLVTTSC